MGQILHSEVLLAHGHKNAYLQVLGPGERDVIIQVTDRSSGMVVAKSQYVSGENAVNLSHLKEGTSISIEVISVSPKPRDFTLEGRP
jgi:hypothetical protein